MSELAPGQNLSQQPIRVETQSLSRGTLTLVTPLPSDFPSTFRDELLAQVPWYQSGRELMFGERDPRMKPKRVELHMIGQTPIVLKAAQYREPRVIAMRTNAASENTVVAADPASQLEIMNAARTRYQQAYGERLPLEEVVGYYVDRDTLQEYLMFRYYEEVRPDFNIPEGRKIMIDADNQARDMARKLIKVGVEFVDGCEHLIVKDPKTENGHNIVLIDTELWRYQK